MRARAFTSPRAQVRIGAALAIALPLTLLLLLAPAAAPARRGTTQALHRSDRGKCSRPARRLRRHRRCHRAKHPTPKAPVAAAPAPLSPTAGLIAPLPIGATPPVSAPPSEVAGPGSGGAEVGEGTEPPSVPHVQVSAVEYAFTLSRATVPAGKVVFQFVNDGQDEHNLNIAPPEAPPVAVFPNLPAKGLSDLQAEVKAGVYTLICSLPTHAQKGMKATLTVE